MEHASLPAFSESLPSPASYSSHAGQRSYVSGVLPACLLSTKSKAVETPILVSGADRMDEELMGNDGGASHTEARYSESGQFHAFTDELESLPSPTMPLKPGAQSADCGAFFLPLKGRRASGIAGKVCSCQSRKRAFG